MSQPPVTLPAGAPADQPAQAGTSAPAPVGPGNLPAAAVSPPVAPVGPVWHAPAGYPAPVIPRQPGPPGWPSPAPPARRGAGVGTALLRAGFTLSLVLALLCGVGDAAAAVLWRAPSVGFVPGTAQAQAAIQQLLTRRATAVNSHDEKAYLADVDQSRPNFVQHEKEEFSNLTALDLSAFTLTVTAVGRYPARDLDPALAASFDRGLVTVSVTVRYAVRGVDSSPVAAPWVPYLGQRDGHWVVADELVHDNGLPEGAGGLPWETGAVVVKRSPHVVAVISVDDERIAPQLLQLAETGVQNALRFQPTGWPGKVLVTAVSDRDVIASYFRDDSERLDSVAAVAVQSFSQVYEWRSGSDFAYVTSRVLFNPDSLGGNADELEATLTHEFIHVATGPITSGRTPTWLVEGIAEYVGEDAGRVSTARLRDELAHYGYPTQLPDDGDFYDIGYRNYLYSALACRYIATTYGKAKLLALYSAFTTDTTQDAAARATLGVGEAQLTSGWLAYLHGLR